MNDDFSSLAEAALSFAAASGADAADVMISRSAATAIDVRNGNLEQAENEESTELGLRVFIGEKQACVATSDLRTDSLEEVAQKAVAMAAVAPDDPFAGLAEQSQLTGMVDHSELDLFDESPPPSPDKLFDIAVRAESAAAAVKGVSQVQSASAVASQTEIFLAASNGFSGGMHRSGYSTSAVAIAGQGLEMERDSAGESRVYFSDLPDAEDIGRLAGERAVSMQGATKPPTGAFPVILDERIAAGFIGHLLAAINGAAIARGASWLRDALGERVLPEGLSIIEDPHRARIRGSRLFDAEGLATQKRTIVENGILRGWTLDLSTGRKLGMVSTANAARGTSAPPTPSLSNIALTQGTASKNDLLSDAGTGLLVTSMIGSTINPNTGDYSRGASGFWIENGEVTGPVNECTLAGNLKDLMRTIVPANDARSHISYVVPSLLIDGMTIAGK